MNKNYLLAAIFILFTSCSVNRFGSSEQLKSKLKVDFVSYQIQDSDSSSINIVIKVPLKNLVFKKQKNNFIANINFTLIMTDRDSKAVVKRIVDNERISVSYYEDTRDSEQFYQIEVQSFLPIGKYNLLSIVEDVDSHFLYKNFKEVDVEDNQLMSKITAYYYIDSQKYFSKIVKEDIDTVWFELQMNNFGIKENEISFNYKAVQDSSIIDSSIISLPRNNQGIYNIPIVISPDWENDITFFIGKNGKFSSIKLLIENKNGTQLWSDNVKVILGIMAYLLPYSEYKEYKKLEDDELFDKVTEYWKLKDPTPTTKKNELLEEINNRIEYVNANFSVVGLGWKSDRGKIYINYGPPESIDRYYNAEYLYNYEIWYYESGRKFTFSDQNGFGELRNINQY